jgi:phenylacetic acid degradation operon negative regulatory protein
MTPPEHPALARARAVLREEGAGKVWSFLATAFGDLAREEDARLGGAVLRALAARAGIRGDAVRVALHRLRKDGWILSHPEGRRTSYALTPHGLAESRAAAPRIYGPAPEPPVPVLLLPPGTPPPPGATPLAPGVALAPGWAHGAGGAAGAARVPPGGRRPRPVPDPPGGAGAGTAPGAEAEPFALPWTGGPVPGWLRERLVPPGLVAQAARFEARLADLGELPPLPPLDRAALRVLAVHGWRRIALRAPHLPSALLPEGWRGEACRAALARLLEAHPAPAPEELAAAAQPARRASGVPVPLESDPPASDPPESDPPESDSSDGVGSTPSENSAAGVSTSPSTAASSGPSASSSPRTSST